jgi:hypothetical protein
MTAVLAALEKTGSTRYQKACKIRVLKMKVRICSFVTVTAVTFFDDQFRSPHSQFSAVICFIFNGVTTRVQVCQVELGTQGP